MPQLTGSAIGGENSVTGTEQHLVVETAHQSAAQVRVQLSRSVMPPPDAEPARVPEFHGERRPLI